MLNLFKENRNFRNFLLYQGFKGIGSGIFAIFMMWVVHSQYQNPFYTGVAGFMFAAPNVVGFIAGPYVDRHNKVWLIRAMCLVQLLVVGLLLVNTYAFGAWVLFLVILVFQIANMISIPAETAYLPTIVDSGDLIKANASIRISATITGLVIGVFLYLSMARGTEFSIAYAVNAAVLFLGLVFAVLMKSAVAQKPEEKDTRNYLAELKAGLVYVRSDALAHLVLVFIFSGILGHMAHVNLPMFAEIHSGEASGYIILSVIGLLGGLIGSYIARAIGAKYELSKIFTAGFLLMGIIRIIFIYVIQDSFTRSIWILALYVGLGAAIGIFFQSLQQKLLPEKIIGRVSTILTSLFSVAAALGSLLGGVMGSLLPNVDTVFIIQGVSYIVISLFMFLSVRIRKLPKISEVVPMGTE
ncbi:MAG: MFS transporter [Firmicutes bacterium]|nr:MFS transporter [Bacillota bacterium]